MRRPGSFTLLPTTDYNWAFQSVPQTGLNGRRSYQPRGKTLGGSSSINGMVYVRGHRSDYDHWASLGNAGWSYDEVLPYFRRAENNECFKDDYHGQGGPLNVANLREPSALSLAFVEAAGQCGLPHNPDYNGATQEGAFLYQVNQVNGERCSAAKLYLTPNLGAAEPRGGDRRAERESADRGRPGGGGALPGRRALRRGAGAMRSHRQLRRLRFAAPADALRHRPGGASARTRHRGDA